VKILYVFDTKRTFTFPAKSFGSGQNHYYHEAQIILWDEWLERAAARWRKKITVKTRSRSTENYGKITP
jgi:hypothetical protein